MKRKEKRIQLRSMGYVAPAMLLLIFLLVIPLFYTLYCSLYNLDSEKSRNRLKLIGVIGGVAAAIVAALASSLGGNIALKESNNIDDDNITDL